MTPATLLAKSRFPSATPRINDIFSLIALGERFRDVVAHAPSAFFQDANYHDQIVNERKRTGATGAATGP
jgi:hypothetical protein